MRGPRGIYGLRRGGGGFTIGEAFAAGFLEGHHLGRAIFRWIWVCLLFLLAWAWLAQRLARVELAIALTPGQPDVLQVFYDVGNGFNETDSVKAAMGFAGSRQVLRLGLPAGRQVRKLRLDVGLQPGAVLIESIAVRGLAGETEWRAEEVKRRFRPARHINRYELEGGLLAVGVNGRDPALVYRGDFSEVLDPVRGRTRGVAIAASFIVLALLAAAIGVFVRARRFAGARQWLAEKTQPARAWLAAHGLTAAAALLLLGALLHFSDLSKAHVRVETDAAETESFKLSYRLEGGPWRGVKEVRAADGPDGWPGVAGVIDDSIFWRRITHLRVTVGDSEQPVRIRAVVLKTFFMEHRWGAAALSERAGAGVDAELGAVTVAAAAKPASIALAAPPNSGVGGRARWFAALGLLALALVAIWGLVRLERLTPPAWLDEAKPQFAVFYRAALAVIVGWFLVQQAYFLTSANWRISPDTEYHTALIDVFAQQWSPILEDAPETYRLGPISTRTYFYHYLMGALAKLNVFGMDQALMIRLVSLAMSLATLYCFLLAFREITERRWVHLAALLMASNVLMFSYMGTMVSYDVFVHLLAPFALYHLLRFVKTYERRHLLWLMVAAGAGMLAKRTFLPLAGVYFLALAPFARQIWRERARWLARPKPAEWALAATAAVLGLLCLELYAGNYLRYSQLYPSCDRVLSHEACLENPIYARDHQLEQKAASRRTMSIGRYARRWATQMEGTALGALVHGSSRMVKSSWELADYRALAALALIALVAGWRGAWANRALRVVLATTAMYLALLFWVNYRGYLRRGVFEVALQGRYAFPVLAPMAIAVAYPLLARGGPWRRLALLLAITVIFVGGGFWFFLERADAHWLAQP